MTTKESSVYRDQARDHHPHACHEGVVYLAYTVHDEAIGDEVEKIEAVPCRRCSESGGQAARAGNVR